MSCSHVQCVCVRVCVCVHIVEAIQVLFNNLSHNITEKTSCTLTLDCLALVTLTLSWLFTYSW